MENDETQDRRRTGPARPRPPGETLLPRPGVEPLARTPSQRRRPFYQRYLLALGLASGLILISLSLGTLGYHHFAGTNGVDSFHNAAMILTGMGPVTPLTSNAAKLFASVYALFSGLIFISATGILLTPIFHRVLHRFHMAEQDLR